MKRTNSLIFFIYFLCLAATTFLLSCNNTKYLPKGETLYAGAEVKIHSEIPLKTHAVKKELERVERPKPNSKLLGMRVKLTIYNHAGKDPGKGIRHWLKTKVGEPPVLASTVSAAHTAEFMKNRLQVRGYFNSKVSFKTITAKQKTKIEYTADLPAPYKIQLVIFPSDSSVLSAAIRRTSNNTLLKEGSQYDLDLFKIERLRIDQSLKDSGFFYFNPEFLLFKADSIRGAKLVKITLTVKPEIPARATVPYHLRNIYIMPYSALNDSVKTRVDTVLVDGYYYLDNDSSFRPKVILNSVFMKKGDLYCRHNHNTTLGHLMGMGVFKYVSISI
jgi:outer membrane protein insertion porin family